MAENKKITDLNPSSLASFFSTLALTCSCQMTYAIHQGMSLDDRDVEVKGNDLLNVRIDFVCGGGIAVIESPKQIRELRRFGAIVRPVLTEMAQTFVSPLVFEWAAKQEPKTQLTGSAEHLSSAEALIISPATLDLLAKSSLGIADSLATTLIQSVLGRKPVVFVPSMHESLRESPSYQEHRKKLEKLPHVFFVDGPLIEGKQKAPSFEDLAQQVCHWVNAFRRNSAKKKQKSALVTLGATMSAVDDVRFLGNQSSGRTGLQIALALYRAGCEVELIAGLHQVQIPSYLQQHAAITHSEMSKAVERFKSKPPDLFVHSAAILDFEVKTPKKMKLTSAETIYLELKPTTKILDKVKWPRTQVVAFKLESRLSASEFQKEIREWLKDKKIVYVVANRLEDVGAHSYRAQIFSGKAEKIADIKSRRELADWLCGSLLES